MECFKCHEPFDLQTRLPYMLPCCGYSLCSLCLGAADIFSCPFLDKPQNDNLKARLLNKSDVPLNHAVVTYLQKYCLIHNKKKKFLCTQDNCQICSYCFQYGDNKNHDNIKCILPKN